LQVWTTGVQFPVRIENASFCHRVHVGSGAHIASYPEGSGALTPVVKRPGREAGHSTPSNAKVRSARRYASSFLYDFMTWWLFKCRIPWYLIKTRDYFTSRAVLAQ
jgi:hypothetical protein